MSSTNDDIKAASPLERMHFFCQKGDKEAVFEIYNEDKKLLNAKGNMDYTALHWAAHSGHDELCEALCKEGADVNVQTKTGDTPLHLAVFKGKANVVKVLLAHNAKTSINNSSNKLAEDLSSVRRFLSSLLLTLL